MQIVVLVKECCGMFLALFTTRICSLYRYGRLPRLTRIEIFAQRLRQLLGHVGMWQQQGQQPHQIVVICYRRSYKHGSYANYDCGMAPASSSASANAIR